MKRKVLQGDSRTWVKFYREYNKYITISVRKKLKNHSYDKQDLEDCVSETWVDLIKDNMRNLRSHDKTRGMNLRSWVSLIASHVAIDWLRKQRTKKKNESKIENDMMSKPIQPDHAYEKTESLRTLINLLKDKEIETLKNILIENNNDDIIANKTGTHIATVRSRKCKLNQKILKLRMELTE